MRLKLRSRKESNMIQVYTGEGKGKTTAALGLSLRAAGYGMKVVIVQFLKSMDTSELVVLEKIDNITIMRNEEKHGFVWNMSEEEKERVRDSHNRNLQRAIDMINSSQCDMLVLDELMAAYNKNMIDRQAVRRLVEEIPDRVELVMTGRDADDFFMEKADYVTEMKKIKHPYDRGIHARRGIEN